MNDSPLGPTQPVRDPAPKPDPRADPSPDPLSPEGYVAARTGRSPFGPAPEPSGDQPAPKPRRRPAPPHNAPAPKPPRSPRFDLSELLGQADTFYTAGAGVEDSADTDSADEDNEDRDEEVDENAAFDEDGEEDGEEADEELDEEAERAAYDDEIVAAAAQIEAQFLADTPLELRLAERYARRYRDDTAFALGQFHRKTNGSWTPVSDDVICAELYAMADRSLRHSVHQRTLVAVLKLLRSALFVQDQRWALQPGWLPCANGALHLASGWFAPYTETDRIINPIPAEFSSFSYADCWEGFLRATLADDVRDFLQEFAGYALTGHMDLELALLLLGPPGSGKSTFLCGLELMLGPRCLSLDLRRLSRGRFSPKLLKDVSLIISPEQPAGPLSSPDRLNSLITGESFTLQPAHQPLTQVRPRAKLACAFTSWPVVDDANSGFFRRMAVVLLPEIPAERRDPSIKARLDTDRERAGILKWAFVGLQRLLERGRFRLPPSVLSASRRLHLTNDPAAQFLEDCCQRGPGHETRAGELYEAYRLWCRVCGHRPLRSDIIIPHWERLGLTHSRSSRHNVWTGVLLDVATVEGFKKGLWPPRPPQPPLTPGPPADPSAAPEVPDVSNPPNAPSGVPLPEA